MTKKNKKYQNVYASVHDVMVVANQLKADDNSVVFDKGCLEKILIDYFGFDDDRILCNHLDEDGETVDSWYETHYCTHKPKLSNTPVTCDRFIGAERQDKEWYETGLMSVDTWNIYKGI